MTWIVVSLVSALAGFVQTVTGFGSVVTMMLVLPYFFAIVDAATMALTISLVFCVVLCWQYRKYICLRIAIPPTITYTLVNLLVIRKVDSFNTERVEIVFAVFLILLSLYYLLVAKRVRVAPKPIVGIGCGVFSGISSAFFAIGGPPMAIYFIAATDSYYSYIGCMQFLFVVTSITGIWGRVANGVFHVFILPYVAVGTACILVGMKIGKIVSRRLNADRMRMLTYLFVGVSGVIFLLQSIL